MNTHDKIELPPLPTIDVMGKTTPQLWFTAAEVDALRRAAIEADRKRRREPVLDRADLAFILDELREAGLYRAANLVAEVLHAAQPDEPVEVPGDEVDLEEVRCYLDDWGCLDHPGVRALLAHYTTTKEQP